MGGDPVCRDVEVQGGVKGRSAALGRELERS